MGFISGWYRVYIGFRGFRFYIGFRVRHEGGLNMFTRLGPNGFTYFDFPGFFLTLEPFPAPLLPLLAPLPAREGVGAFSEVGFSAASWGFWTLSNVLSGTVVGTQHRNAHHGGVRWEFFKLRLLHDETSTPGANWSEAFYIIAL